MATHATQELKLTDSHRSARWRRMQKIVRSFWRGVRDWCGDSAYERYLSATRRRQSQDALLTQEKFYVEQLDRRYSRPNRCC